MVKQIIPADSHLTRKMFEKEGADLLKVSEFFYDSIQGEGINAGVPASFLRLQGCHVQCSYCDSKEVWNYGSQYSFTELFARINSTMLIPKLRDGQHFVITGGSPLLQQDALFRFFAEFTKVYRIMPYVEIENDCTLMPKDILPVFINCWNNSPKLENSGVKDTVRYKMDVLKKLSSFHNSWFKFVITSEKDWDEIDRCYLLPHLIQKEQVILMPEGATREELAAKRDMVIQLAIRKGVRYSDRLHIINWNKKVGV